MPAVIRLSCLAVSVALPSLVAAAAPPAPGRHATASSKGGDPGWAWLVERDGWQQLTDPVCRDAEEAVARERECKAKEIRRSRWLSWREKAEEIIALHGIRLTPDHLPELPELHRPLFLGNGPRRWEWDCPVSVQTREDGTASVWVLPGVLSDPAFAPMLRRSLEIRKSDLVPLEKGRRLLRLVKPWMTLAQVHALFGESEAVFWQLWLTPVAGIVYIDYGVTVARGRRGGEQEEPQKACKADQEKPGVWEFLPAAMSADREEVFNFWIGFTR
jgi:hypothetical protein